MFKKVLLRSFAGATALGSVLALSLVATPAVVTSAPEIRNVACSLKYPTSVSTATSLSMRRIAAYGASTTATATVTRDDAGTQPKGTVRFLLRGAVNKSWSVKLRNGQASVALPRTLPASNTYSVTAKYWPPSCSIFKRSSGSASYTVFKADTRTSVNARDIRRTEKPTAKVVVRSTLTPVGKVRVALVRKGNTIATQTKRLSGGRASASFSKVRPGRYKMKVKYLGTGNFRASSGADTFRVRR
jgi:hypothetical protein